MNIAARRRRAWRAIAALCLCFATAGVAATAAPADCPAAVAPLNVQQSAQARRTAPDRGFLWRIRKDGHDSYLFGSLHVGKPAWAFAGPALRAALAHTDTLALELDLSDPAVARQLGAALREHTTAAAPDVETQRRLQHLRALACVDDTAMQGQPPLLQAVGLTLLAARRLGLDADYAQERMLAAAARAADKPIVSLETARRQVDALFPRDPEMARMMLLDTLAQLESNRAQRTLQHLADAWASGDLQALQNYPRWCECADSDAQRAMLRRLVDDRNPALADAIDALHRDGHRVLAAVGALHMVGANGLPRLMAQRGYTVQRILF